MHPDRAPPRNHGPPGGIGTGCRTRPGHRPSIPGSPASDTELLQILAFPTLATVAVSVHAVRDLRRAPSDGALYPVNPHGRRPGGPSYTYGAVLLAGAAAFLPLFTLIATGSAGFLPVLLFPFFTGLGAS